MRRKSMLTKRILFDAINVAFLLIAALVVIVSPTEEQMLNLGYNSILFAGFFICGLALSEFLNRAKIKTLGELLFESAHAKAKAPSQPLFKSFWGWQLILSFIILLAFSLNATNFSFAELTDEDGFRGAMRLFHGLTHPNMQVLPRAVLNILETIFIAFLATVIAIPIAFILSFLTAKNVMTHPIAFVVYAVLRTVFNVIRSVEPLIWAIIFSVWVGIGPFAGMLALMVHSVASLAKQYSEMVESVSEGPIEGIQSTGATPVQIVWFAIVPQVVLPFISFTIYRWDINVRMATIIGLVGGGGIGTMLIKYQGQAMWPEVGCIILVIAIVVWLMDAASAYLREALK